MLFLMNSKSQVDFEAPVLMGNFGHDFHLEKLMFLMPIRLTIEQLRQLPIHHATGGALKDL